MGILNRSILTQSNLCDLHAMASLPSELLIVIFSQMSYFSLLNSANVCHSWRSLIFRSSILSQRLFKAHCRGDATTYNELNSDPCQIEIHPAISRINYCIGDDLESVRLGSNPSGFQHLSNLDVSNDLAFVPSATHIQGSIPSTYYESSQVLASIEFTTSNLDGVRVIDIFSAIVLASRKKYDMLATSCTGPFYQRLHPNQTPALFKKAEILGRKRFFAGFRDAVRRQSSSDVLVSVQTSFSPPPAFAL